MELKNVIIYFPDGKTGYYEVGQNLLDEKKQPTPHTIKSIKEENNKIIVEFSSGDIYLYSLPYSSKIK